MSIDTKSQERIISLLKDRHMLYAEISEKRAAKDPYWNLTTPLKQRDYSEWLEYGINTIMSETGIGRQNAEIEMSWLESKYRIKVI